MDTTVLSALKEKHYALTLSQWSEEAPALMWWHSSWERRMRRREKMGQNDADKRECMLRPWKEKELSRHPTHPHTVGVIFGSVP